MEYSLETLLLDGSRRLRELGQKGLTSADDNQ
jgi:hypothetical protein